MANALLGSGIELTSVTEVVVLALFLVPVEELNCVTPKILLANSNHIPKNFTNDKSIFIFLWHEERILFWQQIGFALMKWHDLI